MNDKKLRIGVIGAGIIGLPCAYRLLTELPNTEVNTTIYIYCWNMITLTYYLETKTLFVQSCRVYLSGSLNTFSLQGIFSCFRLSARCIFKEQGSTIHCRFGRINC